VSLGEESELLELLSDWDSSDTSEDGTDEELQRLIDQKNYQQLINFFESNWNYQNTKFLYYAPSSAAVDFILEQLESHGKVDSTYDFSI